MGKRFAKSIAIVIIGVILSSDFTVLGAYAHSNARRGANAPSNAAGQIIAQSAPLQEDAFVSEMISRNYTKVSSRYTAPPYDGDAIFYPAAYSLADPDSAAVLDETFGYGKADKVVDVRLGDTLGLSFEVPATALYLIEFDYYSSDMNILPVGVAMKIDGEFPFFECRNLKFESSWVSNDEQSFDRYGDEIATIPDKLYRWESKLLMDGSYRYSAALPIQLEAGEHIMELSVSEGAFYLGGITFLSPKSSAVPEYGGPEQAPGSALIELQGERFTLRNDPSIHAIAEFDTALTPYDVRNAALNTIDADSFRNAGQRVCYEFHVDAPGNYYISMNYRQSDKNAFPVFVDVAIDGEIPNTAFESYGLKYSNSFGTITLTDADGNNLSVYLDEGVHTLSFTISNNEIRHLFEGLDEVVAGVNDLSLEITKVVGKNLDRNRDLRLSRYMPGIEGQLFSYAEKLQEMHDSVLHHTNGKRSVAVLAPMMIARRLLISLAEEPDEIPYRVNELSVSVSSASHHLANTQNNLLNNRVAIDKIWVHQEDAQLPKPPGFFASIWLNLQRFFLSFTDRAYSAGGTNPEHLQVWVNRSMQYVQVMQKMIDDSFTARTGIKVDISIMPDQRKLVLASTAGQSPDVATGINYTIPYELAIRNALVDMTQFEGFRKAAEPYSDGLFLTACINDAIFAMPETMNFWVLFYRSDIMERLGLEIPDTMQDVLDMMPELQIRGLNFYQSASGMLVLRNFHGTSPLIYQHGGSLYNPTAHEGTNLGSPESIKGFTYLTELYTIYNMPINVDNFYQRLRNGDIPLGVADFYTYNLMINAAPELRDAWSIALVPGIEREDGTIDRTTCANAESSVIFKSDPEREQMAWQFVEWWSSAEVQTEYGQTMQITFGDDYMWPTANAEAFMRLPWRTRDKLVIAEQMTHVIDIARVPGTYMLEREISNAFNDIVVNGATAQARIDRAVKTIDREIMRKLEEFEFVDSEGNVLREYRIPTVETIRRLLGRD